MFNLKSVTLVTTPNSVGACGSAGAGAIIEQQNQNGTSGALCWWMINCGWCVRSRAYRSVQVLVPKVYARGACRCGFRKPTVLNPPTVRADRVRRIDIVVGDAAGEGLEFRGYFGAELVLFED